MEVALDRHTKSSTSDDESSIESEVEQAVETGLKARESRRQFSGGLVPKVDHVDGEPSENSTYLDRYGGAIEDLNIQKLLNYVPYDTNETEKTETQTKTSSNSGREVTNPKSERMKEEIMEEEVVELEFEKAIPKLHTHTMHCPNCDSQITKVILRRKRIKRQPIVTEIPHEPLDLLGCFSCFSLFTSTDDGGFNPFAIFGNKPNSGAVSQAGGNNVLREDGNCCSIFRVFRREKDSTQSKPGNIDREYKQPKVPEKFDHPITEVKDVLNKLPIRQGQDKVPDVEGPSKPSPSHHDQLHSTIDILPDASAETQVPSQGSAGENSRSFEILKSIVYGGLMEVIASLSIVASAAAGDATTLNIVALALANLIGGVFVIWHNLWDLRDDCYKFSTQQTSKYEALLGSVEHFPLHVVFTILSFLVFGIIPPVAYGYAFHETNDRDFTMVIVAVASFVCVVLLAIFKAYIDRCTGFLGYVKTVTYYLTTTVAVSGVSYAVGSLASRLIEELGLFETSSNVGMAVVPEVVVTKPSLAYY